MSLRRASARPVLEGILRRGLPQILTRRRQLLMVQLNQLVEMLHLSPTGAWHSRPLGTIMVGSERWAVHLERWVQPGARLPALPEVVAQKVLDSVLVDHAVYRSTECCG